MSEYSNHVLLRHIRECRLEIEKQQSALATSQADSHGLRINIDDILADEVGNHAVVAGMNRRATQPLKARVSSISHHTQQSIT